MTTAGRIKQWAQPKATLKTMGYAVENTVVVNRWAIAGFLATGVITLTFPILNNRLPKIVELVSLGTAPVCFAIGAVLAQQAIDPEKAHASLRLVQKDLFGKQIANAAAVEQLRSKFAQVEEFHSLIADFPPDHQWYFIQQAGLESLYLEYVQALPEAQQQGAIDVSAQSAVIGGQSMPELPTVEVDSSWIDSDFVKSSKAIFAAKGSGKSWLLAFLAVLFKRQHPAGTLLISDLHYDENPAPFDPAKSLWFLGMPVEVLERDYVRSKFEDILQNFRLTRQILRHRISKKLKAEPEFHHMCDEFDGVMRRATEQEAKEISEIIQEVQDEGRKYHVNITLVVHGLKKQLHKIDSTAIAQMDILALGNALSDPNTQFPRDFQIDKLIEEQNEVQAQLPGKARACVYRKLGDRPTVCVVPEFTLNDFMVQYQGEEQAIDLPTANAPESLGDWQSELAEWVRLSPVRPTPEQLAAKFTQLTGLQADGNQLYQLIGA